MGLFLSGGVVSSKAGALFFWLFEEKPFVLENAMVN